MLTNLLYLVPHKIRIEICRHHANKEFAENRSDFYTNGEFWLLKTMLPEVKTVFDVGSHFGKWASQALRLNPRIDLHWQGRERALKEHTWEMRFENTFKLMESI
jgi:hypothetical protein